MDKIFIKERIIDLIYNKLDYSNNPIFMEFDSMYLFTTENVKGYMPRLDGKKVLSVCSSGDQYFEAISNGANQVDLFDLNYFSIYILILKKTFIENLDINLFKKYFGLIDNTSVFDYKTYQLFCNKLDQKTKEFWDYIYKESNYNGKLIYYSSIIKAQQSFKELKQRISYLENYENLQKSLKTKTTNFLISDIDDLDGKLKSSYDSIFLSNINQYKNHLKYIKTIKKLSNYLNNEGSIFFTYIYDYKFNEQINLIFDELLKNESYSSIIINHDKVHVYNKN